MVLGLRLREDEERQLVFDFESLLPDDGDESMDGGGGRNGAVVGVGGATYGNSGPKKDFKRGTVVCRHWLRALCMKGDNCEFLHQVGRKRPRFVRERGLLAGIRGADDVLTMRSRWPPVRHVQDARVSVGNGVSGSRVSVPPRAGRRARRVRLLQTGVLLPRVELSLPVCCWNRVAAQVTRAL